MLKGFIEYYKTHFHLPTIIQQGTIWSKKYCEYFIEHNRKKGFEIGVTAYTKSSKYPVKIIGFVDVPEAGYTFHNIEPCLIKGETKYGSTMMYNFAELELIDTTSGEITC